MTLIVLYSCAYLLGAIPFGLLVGFTRGVDIRTIGSGNIGATNTYRAIGKVGGTIVFLLDVGKGVLPPVVARTLLKETYTGDIVMIHATLMGATAVIGHSNSPFLRFKGGKGVATGLGMLFGVVPIAGVAGLVTAISLFAITRYVSLSSMIACLVVIATSVLTRQPPAVSVVFSIVTALIILRHVPNIKRLLKGDEPKIDFRKNKTNDDKDESTEEEP